MKLMKLLLVVGLVGCKSTGSFVTDDTANAVMPPAVPAVEQTLVGSTYEHISFGLYRETATFKAQGKVIWSRPSGINGNLDTEGTWSVRLNGSRPEIVCEFNEMPYNSLNTVILDSNTMTILSHTSKGTNPTTGIVETIEVSGQAGKVMQRSLVDSRFEHVAYGLFATTISLKANGKLTWTQAAGIDGYLSTDGEWTQKRVDAVTEVTCKFTEQPHNSANVVVLELSPQGHLLKIRSHSMTGPNPTTGQIETTQAIDSVGNVFANAPNR